MKNSKKGRDHGNFLDVGGAVPICVEHVGGAYVQLWSSFSRNDDE